MYDLETFGIVIFRNKRRILTFNGSNQDTLQITVFKLRYLHNSNLTVTVWACTKLAESFKMLIIKKSPQFFVRRKCHRKWTENGWKWHFRPRIDFLSVFIILTNEKISALWIFKQLVTRSFSVLVGGQVLNFHIKLKLMKHDINFSPQL